MNPDERLRELGLELPEPAQSTFVPRLRPLVSDGAGTAYLSGNGPVGLVGRVGAELTLEQGQAAARETALRVCRVLRDELGALDRVGRWLKVLVFVRSAPGFSEQPTVANGFSELIVELWGDDRGLCARSAIGVAELPGGMPVEVEATVALA